MMRTKNQTTIRLFLSGLVSFLLFMPPSAVRAAQFVEIKADIEVTQPPAANSSVPRKWTHQSRCVVGTDRWLIEGDFLRNATESNWLIGDTIVRHRVVTEEIPLSEDSRPPRGRAPVGHESTTVFDAPNGCPVYSTPEPFISWLAFGSSVFLKQDGRRIPFYNARPAIINGYDLTERDPSYSEKTEIFADGFGLPQKIDVAAFDGKQRNSYRVLSSTNFQDRTFPSEFRFTFSEVDNDGDLAEKLSLVGKLTSIRETGEPELPEKILAAAQSQERRRLGATQPRDKSNASIEIPIPLVRTVEVTFEQESFTFVRIRYSTGGALWRSSSAWATDYPDSDFNFSARFEKETGLKADPDGKVLDLTNPDLKNYPFAYMVEGGGMELTPDEVRGLREYLLGGGFLMVDDFWGEPEWKSIEAQMMKVFPEREPVELSIDHPIFHSFFEIPEKPQVPNVALGVQSQSTGITWERPDAKEPHYRGLIDDSGRLMAILCHNTDLGDGWERADQNEYYFREFSLKKAYPMGINIVVYALTH